MNSKRIFGLDLVRVIAMLMVVISHGTWIFGSLFYITIPDWFAYSGVIGVEIFFVLSGFLIGSILINIMGGQPSIRSWFTFMIRRWMRTLPAYYFTLVTILIIWPPNKNPAGHFFQYMLFSQNLVENFPSDNWFNVSWSLSIEEWFYLLFSAATLSLATIFRKQVIVYVSLLMFISTPFAMRILHGSDFQWFHSVHQVVIYRLDAIAYGVLLAEILKDRSYTKIWMVNLSLGLLSVFCGWAFATLPSIPVSETCRHIVFYQAESLGCMLCVAAALRWQRMEGWMGGLVNVMSNQSYSIYLTHMTIIQLLTLGAWNGYLSKYAAIALSPVAIFGVSWCMYRFVEKPFLNRRPVQAERQDQGNAKAASASGKNLVRT